MPQCLFFSYVFFDTIDDSILSPNNIFDKITESFIVDHIKSINGEILLTNDDLLNSTA